LLLTIFLRTPLPAADFPADHRALKASIPYDQLTAFLRSVEKPGFIDLTDEGRTVQGRSLWLVHLRRGAQPDWRVFLYAQQHGNEISGRNALLYLVRRIAEDPSRLPEDVDLWVLPTLNPDGAESNLRRNGNGVDLNRDHLLLSQPETRALHRIARRIRPDAAVDCHEFPRDSQPYADRGWIEWPVIMMDCLNNPLFPAGLRQAGLRWVEEARPVMAAAGHPYARYTSGGVPPDEEQHPATPEADDARNGLGAYGCLSFIIEAGVKRSAPDPNADLGERVDACLALCEFFLSGGRSRRAADLQAVQDARRAPLPAFLPVNYFWGNVEGKVSKVRVTDRATGAARVIPTANFMPDLVVKASVPAPKAYAIDAAAADLFRPLLEAHGLSFEILKQPRRVKAEACTLLRVEDTRDELYNRYEGRQIVRREPPAELQLPAGSLLVPLDPPLARVAVLLLEPCQLYGLYQHAQFRSRADAGRRLPVLRIPQ
jgi:hypothetical protein